MPDSPRHTAHQARFVTACQQLLVLAVICAALTPAAKVMSLDLVPEAPATPQAGGSRTLTLSADATSARAEAGGRTVVEVPLTARAAQTSSCRTASGGTTIRSAPQPVTGYGAIGVTWAPGEVVPADRIDVRVRTATAGTWSGWTDVVHDADHGCDPGSREAGRARPGTEVVPVGDVDRVQVEVAVDDAAPAGLELAVIDLGHAPRSIRVEVDDLVG